MKQTNLVYLFSKTIQLKFKHIIYQLMNVVDYLDLMPCLVKAESLRLEKHCSSAKDSRLSQPCSVEKNQHNDFHNKSI